MLNGNHRHCQQGKAVVETFQTAQQHYLRCAYLGSTRCHQEGIGPAWVIVVVHGCSHIESHQLQGRDVASQAAVAVVCGGVCLGEHIAHVAVGDPAVRIWAEREKWKQ